ncbi:hypothetical protein NHH73_16485 [Oxalobacteraceae bacterium OTU3CINTB1]|nr:hypothetical protein NHH73_16485 [Oxalobacteraceae bacterium OTU3CINTB1]
MPITETIARKAMETGGRLRVKSALNPSLWLCAIVTMPGLCISGMIEREVPLVFQVVIALPVVGACLSNLFLTIFDRDKLQSEDYQIRKRSLELVREKGDRFPTMARTIEAITNPKMKQLEHQEGEE